MTSANHRHRVLVVEDDGLIAADMADVLINAGYDVVGPSGVVADALALLETVGCDIAVLDINLGWDTSEAVACSLRDRGTPFLVVSGYTVLQSPAVFHDAPRLSKPVSDTTLILNVAKLAAKH